ncbi:hypothetical protein BY996DRAFT_7586282 [Phakopsora pachyrhizi]|nr:hypothetical protein BY996DRAFT_7586282 [Phakopsora pachyrhizi]
MHCFIFTIVLLAISQYVLGVEESSTQKLNRRRLVDVDILNRGRQPFNSRNSLIDADILNNFLRDDSKNVRNA